MYDVALPSGNRLTFESRPEAETAQSENPGSQLRTRTATRTVKAAYAVFVDGEQIDAFEDPGAAAKLAKKRGGTLRLIPAG